MVKQVLIVDDSPDIHSLVKALFTDGSVNLHSAMDGKYGLVLANSIVPDLILLDVDMPELNGYEFCAAMKSSMLLSSIPIMFLTGQNTDQTKLRGLTLGAIDYVTKPFNPAELAARVQNVLRVQKRISEMERLARIDPVTELGNKQMFDTRWAAEISVHARSGNPLSCAAITIDDFASLGRAAGNSGTHQIIRRIGDIVRQTFRPEDVACRLALEQFAVLMPDTPLEFATKLAGVFTDNVAHNPPTIDGKPMRVSCSIGVAEAQQKYDHTLWGRAIDACAAATRKKLSAAVPFSSYEPAVRLAV
ncbi:MAG: response regulator [Tepidisphaeraceae bacterium]